MKNKLLAACTIRAFLVAAIGTGAGLNAMSDLNVGSKPLPLLLHTVNASNLRYMLTLKPIVICKSVILVFNWAAIVLTVVFDTHKILFGDIAIK